MKHWFMLIALALAYKVAINVSALFRLHFYHEKYGRYLSKKDFNFEECAPAVLKLFKAAGIKDAWLPCVQPAGYGMLSSGQVSFFDNLASADGQCIELMRRSMAECKGIFKGRILETFSPLYWINCIIYLPRKILEYMGLDAGSIICKIAQIIYWAATPLLVAFRDNIYQYITELLG